MNEKYLLSLVIPTRNRSAYAIEAINQVLSFHDSRIQVVVQDNSDNDSLWDEIRKLGDQPQITYHYSPGVLSFVDNFNQAIELVEGDYVCLIGDDDGITSMMMHVVQYAKERNIGAIRPGLNAVYFWPNAEIGKGRKDDGLLIVTKMSRSAKLVDPKKALLELLSNGALNYLEFSLVKLYHGVVRKEYLDQIRSITGSYFGGLTPDIYASVALSLFVDCVLEINFPLTISGICNRSGSADSATGRHTGRLEDAPHFKGHIDYQWSKLVPSFYSVETIWADSALAAVSDIKPELLVDFNVLKLDNDCLIKYPQFSKLILEHARMIDGVKLEEKRWADFQLSRISSFFLKVKRYVLNPRKRYSSVQSIHEAGLIVERHFGYSGINGQSLQAFLGIIDKKRRG